MTISGTLANGSQAPVGETVAVTLDGVEQSATIGSGGAFSTTFDTDRPHRRQLARHDHLCLHQRRDLRLRQHAPARLTVNPATLTITANPETKVYGTADPALAYTASGFQFSRHRRRRS